MWGTKTNIGYYSQSLDDLYDGNTVLLELRRVAPTVENVELRSFLARFLFVGEDVDKVVRTLSGGEKGRLALAKLIYSQKNVLVLDEPTNHLDIPAREALEAALGEYPGTIITVSHDRFFLDRIATQILSFERDGRVLDYPGNYTAFHDWKLRTQGSRIKAGAAEGSGRIEPTRESLKGPGAGVTHGAGGAKLSKNQRLQLERRVAEVETLIPELQGDAEELSAQMSEPETASNFAKMAELSRQHEEIQSRLKELYDEWAQAAEKLA